MENLDRHNFPPSISEADVKTILQSDAGQQLLLLLKRNGGEALKQAAQAAQRGNYNEAYDVVKKLMQIPNASRLAEEINWKRG